MIFKCKMCGGSLEVEKGQTICECEYCGTKQTVSSTDDEITTNLYNRANNLRMKSEFDKAQEIYEKIITKNPNESEAYWGVILCKYGIEYVEDPNTYKKVPTCHRTQLESVLTDVDYLSAIEKADSNQKLIYEQEAKKIDKLQKDILAIVHNEKPFDVFICYKETDESGKRTVDSALANDIYYQLTQEGLKVFYAAITLENKLGQEYEPYIFSALNSARVMLVVGTKPENFNSVWVKNEWSRYLKLMKNDRSKTLIPCFRDMDAYDLPDEFSHLQAQDMGKIGFINDVVRGIKKLITPTKAQSESTVVVESSNTDTAPLLKRAFLFLEDGKWQDADEYCERVLDIDPENAQAYLGKLMAELKVRKQEQLADCEEPFDNRDNFGKIIRFGNGKLEAEMRGYITHINERNENAHLMAIYNEAVTAMDEADTEATYKSAAELFDAIVDFKDSEILAQQCLDKAEICRKDSIYESAVARKNANIIKSLEEAIVFFKSIPGWKDADEQVIACQKKLEEMKVKEEERLRKAEERYIAAEKRRKKRKKQYAIGSAIIGACLIFAIVLFTVIIPNNRYNKAVTLINEGNSDEAYSIFQELGNYKDSAEKAKNIRYNDAVALMDAENSDEAYSIFQELGNYKDSAEKAENIKVIKNKEKLKNANVGSYVTFGAYEQDNNNSNGKEDVEWLVLAKEGSKVLVISKYALDAQRYNTSHTGVTWETCSLRKWLNGTFINNAFSAEEQAMIPTVTVSADKNPEYRTDPGNATQDKVFLLSITEANQYFTSKEARKCAPTDYAIAQGARTKDNYKVGDRATCWWWLRSPGTGEVYAVAAGISIDGHVYDYGHVVNNDGDAVRPAMWITLE